MFILVYIYQVPGTTVPGIYISPGTGNTRTNPALTSQYTVPVPTGRVTESEMAWLARYTLARDGVPIPYLSARRAGMCARAGRSVHGVLYVGESDRPNKPTECTVTYSIFL